MKKSEEIRNLINQGLSDDEIANRLGVRSKRIKAWRNKTISWTTTRRKNRRSRRNGGNANRRKRTGWTKTKSRNFWPAGKRNFQEP